MEKRNWMKHNVEPRHMVRAYMADTRQARISWIHGDDQPSVGDILAAYPRYTDPGAYVWVSVAKHSSSFTRKMDITF